LDKRAGRVGGWTALAARLSRAARWSACAFGGAVVFHERGIAQGANGVAGALSQRVLAYGRPDARTFPDVRDLSAV